MTDDPSTVLLIEDDDATRTFLADNLTADGYDLLVADCARDGARLLETKFPRPVLPPVGAPPPETNFPALVVLDGGPPDASGLELLRRIRSADGVASRINPQTPVLVL